MKRVRPEIKIWREMVEDALGPFHRELFLMALIAKTPNDQFDHDER